MVIRLNTAKIFLRLINQTDLYAIHDLHSQPKVDEFNTLGIPENIGQTKYIIDVWMSDHQEKNIRNYTFAILNTTKDQLIGLLGLRLSYPQYRRGEIWFKIHPDYWHQGYATEAVNLVLDFGFDTLSLHRIHAGCAVDNMGSIKVLEKVGMMREGRGRQVLPLQSGWSDNYEYAILSSDSRKK